jgi:protein SCO1/2
VTDHPSPQHEPSGTHGRGLLGFAVVGGLALAGGLWLGATLLPGASTPTIPQVSVATVLPQPRPLADFRLVDQDGAPFTLEALRGQWTFLAIGYTHCPDICPTTLATFTAIASGIGDRSERQAPTRFLFVSIDPGRDTPERLAQYVRYFDPGFLGATGDEAQLRAFAAQLGLAYAKVEGQDTALGYLMDHSASVLLVDPDGRLAAIFSAPHDSARMALDFLAIAAARDA